MYRGRDAAVCVCKVFATSVRSVASQFVENRTLWPTVAVAAMDEVTQRALHFLQCGNALRQLVGMFLRDAFDAGTGASPVVPQADQLGDLGHGKTEVAGAFDEAQHVHLGLAVLTVAAVGATYLAQHAE